MCKLKEKITKKTLLNKIVKLLILIFIAILPKKLIAIDLRASQRLNCVFCIRIWLILPHIYEIIYLYHIFII